MQAYVASTLEVLVPLKEESNPYSLRLHSVIEEHLAHMSSDDMTFDSTNMNVLCVDDSTVILSTTARVLRAAGCIVETATDGKVALDMIFSRQLDYYDMILTDLEMPVMDGVQFVHNVRQYEKSFRRPVRTPIFCVSSAIDDKIKLAALTSGADLVVAKPFLPKCNAMLKLVAPVRSAFAISCLA
jgi:two-component system, chemotaxis family, chemotaxis protein CheY